MTNYGLIQMLSNLPLDMDVVIHTGNGSKLKTIKQIYVGNERYLPNGDRNKPDVIVIDIS